jgi:hypothetical protein
MLSDERPMEREQVGFASSLWLAVIQIVAASRLQNLRLLFQYPDGWCAFRCHGRMKRPSF